MCNDGYCSSECMNGDRVGVPIVCTACGCVRLARALSEPVAMFCQVEEHERYTTGVPVLGHPMERCPGSGDVAVVAPMFRGKRCR